MPCSGWSSNEIELVSELIADIVGVKTWSKYDKKVNAVLFDADGVIITLPFRFATYLERELNLTMEHTQEYFNGPFKDCIVGRVDLKQSIAPFLPG